MVNNGQYGCNWLHIILKCWFPEMELPPKTLDGFCKGKSHRSKWMMTGGTPMTSETSTCPTHPQPSSAPSTPEACRHQKQRAPNPDSDATDCADP